MLKIKVKIPIFFFSFYLLVLNQIFLIFLFRARYTSRVHLLPKKYNQPKIGQVDGHEVEEGH